MPTPMPPFRLAKKLGRKPLNCDANAQAHVKVKTTGSGCSKLTTLLVNDSLKFQTLIS